jgi:hypothetical protein
MDFLTPQLLRVLQPGRVCAIHVKDRITPGGINGFGFQTVTRISDACADHFERHGFAFLARKTIVTDVVRENNQTYRLGWSEQCKDGSRMGAGLPEYVMLFRKPPTDRSNGYADLPVVKDKEKYTRPRWQYDAHGFTRSSGNRLLQPEDLDGLRRTRSTSSSASTRSRTCTTSSATWRSPSTSTARLAAVDLHAACRRRPGIRTCGPTSRACAR